MRFFNVSESFCCFLRTYTNRKKIIELCKKVTKCPYCKDINGTIKKCGLLKISHEKFRSQKKTSELVTEKLAEYEEAMEDNKELSSMVSTTGLIHILNPIEVLDLFKRITDEDIPLLLMNASASKPEDMILTRVSVPPLCIRPSVVSDLK